MGKTSTIMKAAMNAYEHMVMLAENGDTAAREWLIRKPRRDCKTGTPLYWESYEEWRAWNQSKGNAIRRMVQLAKQEERR